VILFVLAGLVIGIVVFALIVAHRKPDETEFIRQFERARNKARDFPSSPPDQPAAALKLGRRDFRGDYAGRLNLAACGGDMEIAPELGEVFINSDLVMEGNLRIAAGTILSVRGQISCAEGIYVSGILQADGSIESGQSIHCGDTVSAGGSIYTSGTIGCGRCLQAGGSIVARDNIRAGVEISARGAISAGGTIEAPIVKAGCAEDPRTVTCSRLLRGRVNLGELVETGKGRV